jgi:hypothetical protein
MINIIAGTHRVLVVTLGSGTQDSSTTGTDGWMAVVLPYLTIVLPTTLTFLAVSL